MLYRANDPAYRVSAADLRSLVDPTYRVSVKQLRSLIERIERLEQEKAELAEQIKAVFSEAKGTGYDTKAMRKLIALRKRDRDDIAEEEAVLEMYREALGL